MSCATKATGHNPNWYNVIYHHPKTEKDKLGSIRFQQVENLSFESNTEETIHEVSNINYNDAKLAQLKSWKQNNVYHEVPYEGARFNFITIVCSLKHNGSGITPKARVVVKGFEDSEKDHLQKESPTCLRESLRVIISFSLQQKWSLHAIDIKTAFFTGQKYILRYLCYPIRGGKNKLYLET